MQPGIPKFTFLQEIADQVGIFLSIVVGFIVAQAWNRAVLDSTRKHRNRSNEEWFDWVYALVATLIGLLLMSLWGYFIASRMYGPSEELKQLRRELKLQQAAV